MIKCTRSNNWNIQYEIKYVSDKNLLKYICMMNYLPFKQNISRIIKVFLITFKRLH